MIEVFGDSSRRTLLLTVLFFLALQVASAKTYKGLVAVTPTVRPSPGDPTTSAVPTAASGTPYDFPTFPSNDTLQKHNISKTEEDHHSYYNSTLYEVPEDAAKLLWINMTGRPEVKTVNLLSKSHSKALTVRLSFEFPFYGHLVRNVTVATGGFVYTGDYLHSWLAATQYVAPLMANFDFSLSDDSFVKYLDNGTAFTVQWEKVFLQDSPEYGNYTFQTTLHASGDIIFAYEYIPVSIDRIKADKHPVKVGISDAYIADKNYVLVRQKTVFEYHRVYFPIKRVTNGTVIHLKPLPTCPEFKDCKSCLGESSGFICHWCPAAGRCSDGLDRYRQNWLIKGCHLRNISLFYQCEPTNKPKISPVITSTTPGPSSTTTGTTTISSSLSPVIVSSQQPPWENSPQTHDQNHTSTTTIFILVLLGLVVGSFVLWFVYAYRNPLTSSGQLLVSLRSSQWRCWRPWSWRRGEVRYTAATIHM